MAANTDTPAKGAAQPGKRKVVTTMMMAVMIIISIMSMRGFASQAEYGYTSIFYYLLATLVFLLPYSLVCAELASTWSNNGCVFRWVSEALGARWGWAAIYLDWIMVVIWFPAVLMFAGNSVAFIFWPTSFDNTLADNKFFAIAVLLVVYWVCNFITFRGMRNAEKFSTFGGWTGTLIPAIVLIILGVIYVCTGGHNYIDAHQSFWPNFSNFSNVVLAASIFLFFAGTELQAVHIKQMSKPKSQFPKAVFISIIVILVGFIGCTLAIGFVTPQKDINLLATLFTAYNNLWGHLGVPWLGNVMAVLIAVGVLAQVAVNLSAPSTGILTVGRAGYLPPALQKVNKAGVQTPLLWIQGIIVTILGVVLLVLPSVESAYQILSQMSCILYLLMAILVYVAFVVLRFTEPNKTRGYKVPGGKVGMWIVAIIGIAGALFAMVLSFVPPGQINTGSPVVYVLILVFGSVIFALLPFIVYAYRKKNWNDPTTQFVPFDWEIEGRKPLTVSKWPKGYVPTQEQIAAYMDRYDRDAEIYKKEYREELEDRAEARQIREDGGVPFVEMPEAGAPVQPAEKVIDVKSDGPVVIVKAPDAHIVIEEAPGAGKPVVIDATDKPADAPVIEDKTAAAATEPPKPAPKSADDAPKSAQPNPSDNAPKPADDAPKASQPDAPDAPKPDAPEAPVK